MSIREELLKQATVTTTIDVRFAETDAMGVAHHAAYVIWLETGRVAWLQRAGVPYREIATAGYHFAVTGLHVQYRSSAAFGDTVRLVSRMNKLRSRQIDFGYELYQTGSDALLATATSEHICVDLAGKMTRLPALYLQRIEEGVLQLATALAS